jgi:hypothetical protein
LILIKRQNQVACPYNKPSDFPANRHILSCFQILTYNLAIYPGGIY